MMQSQDCFASCGLSKQWRDRATADSRLPTFGSLSPQHVGDRNHSSKRYRSQRIQSLDEAEPRLITLPRIPFSQEEATADDEDQRYASSQGDGQKNIENC